MTGSPCGTLFFVFGAVAQWSEQGTHNPRVVGSIPTRPTNTCDLPRVVAGATMLVIERGEVRTQGDASGQRHPASTVLLVVLGFVLAACGVAADASSAVPPPTTTTTVVPLTTIPGRVVDESGAPITGARVHTYIVGTTYSSTLTVDADGRFELTVGDGSHLPPGQWEIGATAYPPPERHELLPQSVSLGMIGGPLVTEIEFVLSATSTITVDVSAGGQPADAWVYLVRGNQSLGSPAVIDGPTIDGVAEFEAVPLDDYRVFVNSRTPGFADEWYDSTPVRSEAAVVSMTGGDRNLSIELEPEAVVTGRLFLPDGTPAHDAAAIVSVDPLAADVYVNPCRADVSAEPVGTFVLGCLHPGADYRIVARWQAPDGSWLEASATVQVAAGETTVVDLYLGDDPAVVPVVPGRLVDSRLGGVTVDGVLAGGGVVDGGSVLVVPVVGRHGVPESASAVVLNVTAVRGDEAGHLTVFPCGGDVPTASNVNFVAGGVVANSVTVKLGSSGEVCVFGSATVHVVVDVNAYVSGEDAVVPVVPGRLVDSRLGGVTVDGVLAGGGVVDGGSVLVVPVVGRHGVPESASAVVLNVTAVRGDEAGHLTVFPCGGDVPTASNVNFVAGGVVANSVTVKLGSSGEVCVFGSATVHVVVDVNAYVSGEDAVVPVVPGRLVDSRLGGVTVDGVLAGGGVVDGGSVLVVPVVGRHGVPESASAVVLNVTAVRGDEAGHLTVFPCGGDVPTASNVNFVAGGVVANSVTVKLGSSGEVCVFGSATVHVVVDVNAYATG